MGQALWLRVVDALVLKSKVDWLGKKRVTRTAGMNTDCKN
jgi:hypothetical protein